MWIRTEHQLSDVHSTKTCNNKIDVLTLPISIMVIWDAEFNNIHSLVDDKYEKRDIEQFVQTL